MSLVYDENTDYSVLLCSSVTRLQTTPLVRNSQPQKFTDSVLSFLSKQLNSGIAGRWQKKTPHREFMVDWNLYGIPAIHQFCSEFNCLHRKLNTESVNYCG